MKPDITPEVKEPPIVTSMMTESADGAEPGVMQPYVSCIRIYGRPILPPLMTAERRDEMQHYKELAELVATKLKSKINVSKRSLQTRVETEEIISKETSSFCVETQAPKKPTNQVTNDSSFKCVDTQQILEEFDPFAPSTRSRGDSESKCRHSGSSDEFSTSKADSSINSVAMTNSTDLYHYMDITSSSMGDGRTTRRSVTPLTGEWDSPPSKMVFSKDEQIKATYEGLNEYLDSILMSRFSSPPSRTKCSEEEATPTNENLPFEIGNVSTEKDERSRSCPLSPIPHNCMTDSAVGSVTDTLVDVAVQREKENDAPRLVRSNSYTLDAPSPMLLAHLEAEKKKKSVKQKIARNTRNKDKQASDVTAPKRNDVESRVMHNSSDPSSPKSPKVVDPSAKMATASSVIGQPEVRKIFADLQAEHNRQMEQLLLRQRQEQEMIRKAILAQKDSNRGAATWAQCLRTNSTTDPVIRDIRKSLSSSLITSSSPENDRDMTLSAPPGSLAVMLSETSPKRPSSSPALTSCSVCPREAKDTNGNLTEDYRSGITSHEECVPEIVPSKADNVLTINESLPVSPRTRRRVWGSRHALSQDPDWLEINRQRQMHWAASKIQAGVRGYLTRRLLRTDRVQGCITVIHDTILCALELQKECARNVEPSDLQLHGRLIHQLSDACREIHSIFVETPIAKRMAIIAMDRERLENRSPRINGPRPRPLSRATQIALTRKMAQNSHNNSNTVGNTVSTTRRKNWANIKARSASCTQDSSCEIVPSCLVRSATISNGDTQRSVSGGCPRKPWR